MKKKARANARNTEETNKLKVTVAKEGENEEENHLPHSLCCLIGTAVGTFKSGGSIIKGINTILSFKSDTNAAISSSHVVITPSTPTPPFLSL